MQTSLLGSQSNRALEQDEELILGELELVQRHVIGIPLMEGWQRGVRSAQCRARCNCLFNVARARNRQFAIS